MRERADGLEIEVARLRAEVERLTREREGAAKATSGLIVHTREIADQRDAALTRAESAERERDRAREALRGLVEASTVLADPHLYGVEQRVAASMNIPHALAAARAVLDGEGTP